MITKLDFWHVLDAMDGKYVKLTTEKGSQFRGKLTLVRRPATGSWPQGDVVFYTLTDGGMTHVIGPFTRIIGISSRDLFPWEEEAAKAEHARQRAADRELAVDRPWDGKGFDPGV